MSVPRLRSSLFVALFCAVALVVDIFVDARTCTVSADCSDHAVDVTVSTDNNTCLCNCSTHWTGARCSSCPSNFNASENCDACAYGFISYPLCTDDRCSRSDCSNHSETVTGVRSTGCNCTCMNMYEGATCDYCPSRFDSSPRAMCSGCAPMYDPWPDCYRRCTYDNCSNHASAVTGNHVTGCHCTCIPGWTGAECDTCPTKYRQSDCAHCAEGLGDFPECVPICTNAGNCSGHALSVVGVVTKTCTCTCLAYWSGPQCDFCDPDRYAGENCDQCASDYSGPNCEILCSKEVNCSGHALEAALSSDGTCSCFCRNNWGGPDCSMCPAIYNEWMDCTGCSAGEEYFGQRCEHICSKVENCSNHALEATPILSTGGCSCQCRNRWLGADCSVCPSKYDRWKDCATCAKEYYIGIFPNCLLGCTLESNCSNHAVSVSGDPAVSCSCVCRGQWHGNSCEVCDSPPYDRASDCSRCLPGRVRYPSCVTASIELSGSHSQNFSETSTISITKSASNSMTETISILCPKPSVVAFFTLTPNKSSISASNYVDRHENNITLIVIPSPNIEEENENLFSLVAADPQVISVDGAQLGATVLHSKRKLSLIVRSPLSINLYADSTITVSLLSTAFDSQCVNGTAVSAKLSVVKETSALPYEAKQTVETIGTAAGVVSVASLATTTSLQLARANVMLTLSSCAFSHTAPLDKSISPTGVALGARVGQYYRGAVVVNISILLGVVVVHILAAFTIFLVCKSYRTKGRSGFTTASQSIFFPGLQVVPFCLFLPGTVSAALALWLHGEGDRDAVIAVVSLNVLLVGVVLFSIAVSNVMFEAGYEKVAKTAADGKPIHFLDIYFLGRYRWIASGAYWNGFCYLFHTYRHETKWFLTVELTASYIMGLLGGIRPEPSGCTAVAVFVVVASAIMVVLAYKLRPHKADFDVHHNAIHSTLILTASVMMLCARLFFSVLMEMLAQILIIVAVALAILRGCVYGILWMRSVSWGEMVKMQRVELGEARTFTYAFYPLWSPNELIEDRQVSSAPLPASGRRLGLNRRRWNWAGNNHNGELNDDIDEGSSDEKAAKVPSDTLEVPMLNMTHHGDDLDNTEKLDISMSLNCSANLNSSLVDLSPDVSQREGSGSPQSTSSPRSLRRRKRRHLLQSSGVLDGYSREMRNAQGTPGDDNDDGMSKIRRTRIPLPDGQLLPPEDARRFLERVMGRAFLTSAVDYAIDLMFSMEPPTHVEIERDLAVLVGRPFEEFSRAIMQLAVWEGSVL